MRSPFSFLEQAGELPVIVVNRKTKWAQVHLRNTKQGNTRKGPNQLLSSCYIDFSCNSIASS
uniref:Uncharacterized protein n=1 Tax=Arundo donax TaxID=35708 RepID=A0A0A9A7E4_ARUDO